MMDSLGTMKRWAYVAAQCALQPFERCCLRFWSGEGQSDPIFIIGAPRSGSTLLYQLLVTCWDVSYFNNFEAIMPRNIAVLSFLSRVMGLDGYRGRRYASVHGHTAGLDGPAECGSLWYRWFPVDHHAVEFEEVGPDDQREMRRVLQTVTRIKSRPIVVKNLNCGQRLRVLSKVFPNAIYLFCRRDPFFVAQSLLLGRLEKYGDMNAWWSVMPEGYEEVRHLPAARQVAEQVYRIESRIFQDLETLCPGRWTEVGYEAVCMDLVRELDRIDAFFNGCGLSLAKNKKVILPELRCSSRVALDAPMEQELRVALETARIANSREVAS